MARIRLSDIQPLVSKLNSNQALTAAERPQVSALLEAMALTIRTLDKEASVLKARVRIHESTAKANAASRSATLAALKTLAPPDSTIDFAKALKDATAVRKDIQASTDLVKTVVAAARFSVKLMGRLV